MASEVTNKFRTGAKAMFNPAGLVGQLKGGGITYHKVTDALGNKFKLRGNIDKQREVPGYNNLTKAVRAMQGIGGKPSDAAGLLRRGVGLK